MVFPTRLSFIILMSNKMLEQKQQKIKHALKNNLKKRKEFQAKTEKKNKK